MIARYTFRYSNADGSFGGVTVMDCKDRQGAERNAAALMPTTAASFQIWRDNKFVCQIGVSGSARLEPEQESLGR